MLLRDGRSCESVLLTSAFEAMSCFLWNIDSESVVKMSARPNEW